jgi:hypothetical protein
MPGTKGRQGIEVFRLESGEMAERQATVDALGVLRQLGIMPSPARRCWDARSPTK